MYVIKIPPSLTAVPHETYIDTLQNVQYCRMRLNS